MNELKTIAKHWAIEPDILRDIITTYNQHKAGLSVKPEEPLTRNCKTTIRDGIAVVHIHGVITPHDDLFTYLIGGTALDTLALEIHAATQNDNINAILLDFDSPGGVAVGPSELAELINAASQIKPVWSYVGRNCCSAAYWLASATSKIVCHKSAILGSIGIVSCVPVQESPDMDGYKQIEIVSSNAKNKRPDPRTDDGLNTIRAELDSIENEFISSICTYRKTDENTVKTTYGQGGVLIGAKAVEVGMADSLSTYEKTISELYKLTTNPKGKNTMEKKEPQITPEQAQALRAEGAKAERERILALEQIITAGHEDLLAKAKADPDMTAEKLALEIMKAEKAKESEYIASLKAADSTLPSIDPSRPKANAPIGATPDERAEHEWNTNADVRKEFGGDKAAFFAFYLAQENGQIKVLNKGE